MDLGLVYGLRLPDVNGHLFPLKSVVVNSRACRSPEWAPKLVYVLRIFYDDADEVILVLFNIVE